MIDRDRRGAVMRMFSSALGSQAVLSATSFAVGLLLIRRTSDLQYGYYILVSGAIILASSLQNAFIAPEMVKRMTEIGAGETGNLTGGLYREQRIVIVWVAASALTLSLGLWAGRLLDTPTLLLLCAAVVAAGAVLRREYFRMVLMAQRHAHEVLLGDCAYSILLAGGVMLATLSREAAASAVLVMGFAAWFSGTRLSRSLRGLEPWNLRGAPGILRQIAPLGVWSTAGAGIHWSFSQGYAWMIAGTLDVSAVAAIAATRLLAMPVNLLSSGIGSLMLPLAARWLHEHGAPLVLQRLTWFAVAIAGIALCYFGALWLLRDWVFVVLLKKQFAQRDLLLMLWSASFVMMVIHQQLLYLLVVRGRFRALLMLALISAVFALASSYWGMLHFGGAGAPMGVLVGELINSLGIVLLCRHETAPGHADRHLLV